MKVIRTPVKRSDACTVKSASAVILYISAHGMPLVQSNYLVRTNCCIKYNNNSEMLIVIASSGSPYI